MRINLLFLLVLIVIIGLGNQPAYSLGTAFTYQGQVEKAGTPISASADFRFRLFTTEPGQFQVGEEVESNQVNVRDGLFTVQLDFGADVFTSGDRWLDIAIRSPSGEGDYTTLAPRQLLTPVPYSLQTRGIFVDEEERVGIGTYSPDLDLQVSDFSNATAGVKSRQAVIGEGVYNQWLYLRSGTGLVGTYIKRHSSNELAIGSEPEVGGTFSEDMRITKEGNVGIGTTDPTAVLEVRSTDQQPAVEVDGGGPSGTALMIRSGAIRVQGPNTENPVFVHYATSSNSRNCDNTGCYCYQTVIDHPMTNNDPTAILFVTANGKARTGYPVVQNAYYDTDVSKWVIRSLYPNYFCHGQKFNVLVVKQ